MFVNKV